MLLNEDRNKSFNEFLLRCSKYRNINVNLIKNISETTIKYLFANKEKRQILKLDQSLENRWYNKLNKGIIDYSVYDTDEYIAELWACWIVYSKKYLLSIQKESSLPPYGIVKDFGKVKKIVDLGCGFGYTTLALKQMFPNAEVIGTNIENTIQIKFAKQLGKENNFKIISDIKEINGNTDLVFASEYFEHIQEPIINLQEIIKYLNPRNFLIANAFGTRAIGHFNTYIYNNNKIDSKLISKIFNKELKQFGYEKIKTKLWNNRPAYYKLKEYNF